MFGGAVMFVVYNTETGWSDESMRFESRSDAEVFVDVQELMFDVSYAIREEL